VWNLKLDLKKFNRNWSAMGVEKRVRKINYFSLLMAMGKKVEVDSNPVPYMSDG
jgi:hypothetical protein